MKLYYYIACLVDMFFFCACSNDENSKITTEDSIILETNRFVHDIMNYYYYWKDELPDIDYTKETNPIEYFEKLRNSKDRFSFIFDNGESFRNSIRGISKTYGYIITYIHDNENNILGIIGYVFPHTAADRAGLKRGDIIYLLNGKPLNENNYKDVQKSPAITINYHRYDTQKKSFIESSVFMEAQMEILNSVAEYTIFDNHIGYLFYTNYYPEFNDDLNNVFQYFKENNVTDLILDLRYNSGGESNTTCFLCSMIAPWKYVENNNILQIHKYNSNHKGHSYLYFFSNISVNLNLKRIVILTSNQTYSASEATILGLKPYMDVICIGCHTGGKNTGLCLLDPSMFNYLYQENFIIKPFDSAINNWLIAPITSVFYNANNETFNDYIEPYFQIDEIDYYSTGQMNEIGNITEPLIQAAVNYLTTGNIDTPTPTCTIQKSYQIIETYFSPFDDLKGMIIE